MATLPQPKLAQDGFNWIVCAGRPGLTRAAFLFASDAAEFAKSIDDCGMRVSVGHTVFGWADLMDVRQSAAELGAWLHEWAQEFHNDPHHAESYKLAVTRGVSR